MFDFEKLPFVYWDDTTKASFLQRAMLIHSALYYELSYPVISDGQFDHIMGQLCDIRSKMGERNYQKTEYYYCFKDFEGITGYYLYDALRMEDRKKIDILCNVILMKHGEGLE